MLFPILGVVIGAMLTAGVDYFLGINWTETSFPAQVVHKVTYMAWGAAMISIL